MDQVQKALDTVIGANFERQDLSRAITLLDGPPRPITQYMPEIAAKGTVHYWDEQNLIKAGAGTASYPQGARPTADAVAPTRPTNVTCNIGKTAQVTDNEQAVWTGSGSYQLMEGETERLMQEAIDFQTALKTAEVLNEMEWMHLAGDSTNPQAFTGGQCDGLYKWVLNNGVVGAGSGSTTNADATLVESFIKDLAAKIAVGFPTLQPDTLLVPPEHKEIVNGFIGGGAGRPIVQMVNGDNGGLVGGNEVTKYNTGYSVVDVRIEPYLSNTYYTGLPAKADILYNRAMVKQATLIKLGAEPLARIDTSISRMVTCVFTQEHRAPLNTGILKDMA